MKEVLGYFVRHPQASDDLEGLARWRLLEATVRARVQETHAALDWLVARGFLRGTAATGSTTVFSLNADVLEDIRAFLEADESASTPEPHGGRSDIDRSGGSGESIVANAHEGEAMPATVTNKSRALLTVELKSGDWIHLAPGETSAPIDDLEVHENDRVAKLVERRLVALGKPAAERPTPSEERGAKAEEREGHKTKR